MSGRIIARFDRVARTVHWLNALLFLVLLATGAALYLSSLAALVGRRELLKRVHVIAGLALPVPVLLGLALPAGRALRDDVARLNRWTRDDRRWWFRRRRASVSLGKFNPGQKLNAAFIAGTIPVMLATGAVMRWFSPFPNSWREGATFTHDVVAWMLLFGIVGHILLALADPAALRAMVSGGVPAEWAARKRPAWYDEVAQHADPFADTAGQATDANAAVPEPTSTR